VQQEAGRIEHAALAQPEQAVRRLGAVGLPGRDGRRAVERAQTEVLGLVEAWRSQARSSEIRRGRSPGAGLANGSSPPRRSGTPGGG
jgi:hypothetical protein